MASTIKVNNFQSQCGSCGTITIGGSGDTVSLGAGASQTGFGRTGTVDWDTTAKTASFTAVSGNGYFANTTSAAFTITLPASPSAGDIVAVRDYAQTFATNNLTIGRNSQPIDGQTFDLILDSNGLSVTLVYVDGTQGWKSVNSNEVINQQLFITATGGTITTCGDYKIHTFTGPGTFCVSCGGNAGGSNTVDYVVIAGGGSGGTGHPSYNNCGEGGGGGAGGYREGYNPGSYTASPLATTALPVTATGYPITVGAGGGAQPGGSQTTGNKGSNSVFSTITSAGGGGANGRNNPGNPTSPIPAAPACGQKTSGGSGGGAGNADDCASSQYFGSGNYPPVSPPQGNPGGRSAWPSGNSSGGGGGGGASAVGGNAPAPGTGGTGGDGVATSITGSSVTRAGGGGGSANNPGTAGSGGSGGGGNGVVGGGFCGPAGAGTVNTGSGGGGGGGNTASGAGGSGIVIIRYKYQ